jgi:hypothetical protein
MKIVLSGGALLAAYLTAYLHDVGPLADHLPLGAVVYKGQVSPGHGTHQGSIQLEEHYHELLLVPVPPEVEAQCE